jgi:hypothetical protein
MNEILRRFRNRRAKVGKPHGPAQHMVVKNLVERKQT